MIILATLLLICTIVNAQLTQYDASQSLKIMNKERVRHKLPKVTYNYTIQKQLESIPVDYWFSTSLNKSYSFYLGTSLRVRPYNLYHHTNVSEPFKYVFHDTVKLTMSSIFSHRAKQRNCLKLKKCSNDSFNWFFTCGATQKQVQDSVKCSWHFHYYPRMILGSLREIGCILPPIQGPNTSDHLKNVQKKVFICFGNYGNITSDNPLEN